MPSAPAFSVDCRRPAHRTAERHTSGQLLGNGLGDQLGLELGVLDLEHVDLNLLAGQLLERSA